MLRHIKRRRSPLAPTLKCTSLVSRRRKACRRRRHIHRPAASLQSDTSSRSSKRGEWRGEGRWRCVSRRKILRSKISVCGNRRRPSLPIFPATTRLSPVLPAPSPRVPNNRPSVPECARALRARRAAYRRGRLVAGPMACTAAPSATLSTRTRPCTFCTAGSTPSPIRGVATRAAISPVISTTSTRISLVLRTSSHRLP